MFQEEKFSKLQEMVLLIKKLWMKKATISLMI